MFKKFNQPLKAKDKTFEASLQTSLKNKGIKVPTTIS
jgi:hypothetical protein|tara:strand:+ start:336 stop:446 length:111 start_codon:yes stop_codon:yes gene_type:complete